MNHDQTKPDDLQNADMPKRHRSHKGGKKRRAGKIVAIVLGSLLCVALLGAAGVYAAMNNPQWVFQLGNGGTATPEPTPTPTPPPTPTPTGTQAPTPTPSPTPEPTPEPFLEPDYQYDQSRIHILALGIDSSIERVEAGMNFRSDTILLLSVDFENQKVDILSIPRDTYTLLYRGKNNDQSYGKINAAFASGGKNYERGIEYAKKTISRFLGNVKIDYYVGFDMQAVKDIVDAMGGIEYDVDIRVVMNGRVTEPGKQILSGQQVLDYCRLRHVAGGDFGRIDRQQRMLFTIFNQMKSADQLKNAAKIFQSVSKNMTTDLDVLQISALAWFAKDLNLEENIQRHTIKATTMTIKGSSYVLCAQGSKVKALKGIFGSRAMVNREEEDGDWIRNTGVPAMNQGLALVTQARNYIANEPLLTAQEIEALNALFAQWGQEYGQTDFAGMIDVLGRLSRTFADTQAAVEARRPTPAPTATPTPTPAATPTPTATPAPATPTPMAEATPMPTPTPTPTQTTDSAPTPGNADT